MKWVFGCLWMLPLFLEATDLSPWTGYDLELHPRVVNQLQKHPSHWDNLFGVGIEGSYDVWQADIEVNMASTQKLLFGFDDLRLMGRYRWFDDVIGDPVTLTTGVTLIKPTHHSLRDPDLFHHGTFEGEAHAAVGKEWSYQQYWTARLWGVGAFGMANRGYPWLRGNLGWERNWCDAQAIRLYVNTLWGLGHKTFHKHDFHGYGPIHHQSVDLGLDYSFQTIYNSTLTIGYAYRLYAKNFPKYVNTLSIQWMVPIGL